MKDVAKLVTIFFVGTIVVLIVTHAQGFATSAGSIFTGVNSLGTTLTGTNVKNVQK